MIPLVDFLDSFKGAAKVGYRVGMATLSLTQVAKYRGDIRVVVIVIGRNSLECRHRFEGTGIRLEVAPRVGQGRDFGHGGEPGVDTVASRRKKHFERLAIALHRQIELALGAGKIAIGLQCLRILSRTSLAEYRKCLRKASLGRLEVSHAALKVAYPQQSTADIQMIDRQRRTLDAQGGLILVLRLGILALDTQNITDACAQYRRTHVILAIVFGNDRKRFPIALKGIGIAPGLLLNLAKHTKTRGNLHIRFAISSAKHVDSVTCKALGLCIATSGQFDVRKR